MSVSNKTSCFYCGKVYKNPEGARKCESEHNVIYVPILYEDLNRLVNYIASGDRRLLNERIMKTLFRYIRGNDVE